MKKNNFKFPFVFLFTYSLIHLATVSYAGGVGTGAADFLKLAPDARAVALGNAYVAVADEANAIYWNPAGLGQLKSKEFTASYLSYVESINYGFLGFVCPQKLSAYAIGINYLNTSIERVRELDASPTGDRYEKDGNYTAGALTLILSYGRRIFNNLSLGLSLKVINEKLDDSSANAYALDLGGLWKLSRMKIGFAVQNIGTKLKDDSLPMNFRLGGTYSLLKGKLLTALALNYSLDKDFRAGIGLEYLLKQVFLLRFGYEYGNDLVGLTCGLGFKFRAYRIDYAVVPYTDFGLTHRVSFSARF
ncbi:MAG TPA: hypothetical protein DHV62_03735 [Elusimicrobia bacterium]|jgi:long-subunit fatty acid transport protein|nr:hypothetical protein [Elusimicrobiota bacterium]